MAIAVSWKQNVDGLPDARAWSEAIASSLKECREKGATCIESRVVTASEGVDSALMAARAALHRDSLSTRGFQHGEDRVEYRMPLDEALAALAARKTAPRLAWANVDTAVAADLARAAGFFQQAAEGDPASHAGDDALGFLKTLLADEETLPAPERIQIGTCEGVPAAVLALTVFPSDGWASISYLGVLPTHRGHGLGAEAMARGLRCLKMMGGQIYHDGTGSRNAAARALFARLGRPPFRTMEEWRLAS